MNISRLLSFILLLLCAGNMALAQSGNGSVSGTVQLAGGKPAAFVVVAVKGTTKADVTKDNGSFIIRNVADGRHELVVELAGHAPVMQEIAVTAGNTTEVIITLDLSQQQLDEVIVQGTGAYKAAVPSSSLRLAAPLQETPQNIQIITNKVLADQQITSISDGLIRNVSGLTKLEHWGDMYARINMRGDRVAAFRNGMNVTSTWGPLSEDMSFVDHVEFVKGPAGFMMANGDPAGIYNIVTKKPTGQTKGEAGVMFGSYDFYRANLDLDGRFDRNGKVLYRLNLMGQNKGSFRPYEYNDRYSIAPVITYNLDDKTSLTAEYVYQHANMSNVGSYYLFSATGLAELPRNMTFADPNLDPTVIDDHNFTVNLQHRFNDNWKITAQASYFNYQQQGSSLWLNSIDSAGNAVRYVGLWDASNISKFGQIYLNGHVMTGTVRHRILAGMDLGDKEYLADWNQSHNLDLDTAGGYFNIYNPTYGAPANGYPVFDRSLPLRQRSSIIAQQYTGLYLQDELGFFDNRLRLTLAGRYTYAEDNSYMTISSAKRFTPRLGLSADVDKTTAIYALYDQSFVPQTGVRRDGKTVTPLTGNNIEAGIKKELAGGRWNATASVYRILKNNQISNDPTNGAGENFVVQFGQTRTQGVELDIRGEVLPGLSVIANYAYTDSKITKADTSETSQATIGMAVPGFAKHVANGWITYRERRGILKGLGVNAGFSMQADRTTWSLNAPGFDGLPTYFRLDGGLSYNYGAFTITANVFNILDEYLYSGEFYSWGGYYDYQVEAPRNFRVGINYKF